MKKYISIIFAVLAVTASSCKKTYLDELKDNPNTPSVASPGLLLSGSLKNTASIINGTNFIQYGAYVGYLSRSTGFQVFTNLDQYQITTADFNSFTPLYSDVANYNAIVGSNSGANYTAIAKIMLAYDFEALVDGYNNVPYFAALQGAKNFTPAYDDASKIYDDLLVQLDASIKLIQGATAADINPGVADIMFGGNMTNWLKFANTLKLRIAIRQSNIAAKTAALKAATQATQALGYLDGTTAGTVNPGYTNNDANGGQQNPLYITFGYTQSGSARGGNQNYQANSYAINYYTNNSDPRLTRIYAPNPAGNVIGSFFGGTVTSPVAAVTPSKFGPGVLSPTAPGILISAEESLFLQAEAVAAGYITTGTAQGYYNAGITASFAKLGVTNAAAAATTYIANHAYPTGGTFAQQQEAIITQKWAALNPFGEFEAFNELRRTGYPANIPLSIYPGANPPNQVTRIQYPTIEYAANAANVGQQGTINIFTSKIFWAK